MSFPSPPERHRYREINHFEDILKIPDPVASKKWDGAAFWIMFDSSGRPHFISRKPSVSGAPIERTAQLPHLSDVQLPEFANHVFYSELVHTGHGPDNNERHNLLSGILNSGISKSLERQKNEGPVRVILTDMKHPKAQTYREKRETLERLKRAWGKPGLVETPGWREGPKAIADLLETTKRRGDEGIIITSDTLPEEHNTRYKVKHTGTYNLKVSGVQQEVDKNGSPKESMGGLHVVDASGREVATVGTGFSRAEREDAWKNRRNWIGKVIQVKAMPPTANRLRAPVYNGEADGDLDSLPPYAP